MKNEILEKYGYLIDDSMKNFDYESCKEKVDYSKPLKMCHADRGDMDEHIIKYLSGEEGASFDMEWSFDEMCHRIGFYDRHPEYIGKIDF
jgi:hypothetical protein